MMACNSDGAGMTADQREEDSLRSSVFYLAGPTASGKSTVAAMLAQRVRGSVINADAFQLYEGLHVCTAKPGPGELSMAPHHLFGVLLAEDSCDAQRFRDLAIPAIRAVLSEGRWPIVVGGSGLYVKALTHGLATLPKPDMTLRMELAQLTPEERVQKLLQLDPDAASNVPLRNDRYVSRALEICVLTGQPQSALRQTWAQEQPQFMGVLLSREREDLYSRINQRVQHMVQEGAVDEVRALTEQLGDQSATGTASLLKAIGVTELRAFLKGEMSLQQATEAMQQSTRRYAKRQMTWFRRERGFQTVCLSPDSTAQFAVERILELFPCLHQPPPSVPSL